METIQPIETKYDGVVFRSRLEARWAVLFDKLGINWVYEHEGYETPHGRYVPDFWLPDVYMRSNDVKGIYFEVKPESYVDYLHPELEYICKSLKVAGILAKGFPKSKDEIPDCLWEIAPDWDNGMTFRKCSNGHVIFDYCEYAYDDCVVCSMPTMFHVEVETAINVALKNRFW